jgi:iron complex outermembrane receptor protein
MTIRNLIVSVLLMSGLFAQAIHGVILDTNSKPLEGANVVVVGTTYGAVSDKNGVAHIDIPSGTYDVEASFIGYSSVTKTIVVGDKMTTYEFVLSQDYVALSDVEVLASRASENTPVAYTNVTKEEFETRLGSQDIPMILNTTPSVYRSNDKRSSTKRYGKWLGLLVQLGRSG